MESATNIFIVNLDKDTKKWDKVKKDLSNYPIKYTRFSAILGKNLDKNMINYKVSYLGRNFLLNYGAVGCYLSHTELWKRLINDSENDFYLIFEDDFVINDFQSLNKLYISYLDKKINKNYLSFFLTHSSVVTSDIELVDGVEICKKLFHISTVGYFITKQGAKNFLLRLGDKIHYHIDISCGFLSKWYQDCEIWHTKKNLISIEDEGLILSNISESKQKYTIFSNILSPKTYYSLQFPIMVYKMKNNITLETLLSFILSCTFLLLLIKSKNKIYNIFLFLSITNLFLTLK